MSKKIEAPRIVHVYKELDLIAKEVNLRFSDDDDDGSVVIIVDPDPDVTETITCTDCVCSSSRFKFAEERINPPEIKFLLPKTIKLAEEVKVTLRKSAKG